MRLVPRQLRRSDFPSSVPYYGGRLTPDVIAGIRPSTAPPAPPATPMPTGPRPLPAARPSGSLAALEELRTLGLLTDAEYRTIRQRIGAQ